jgi:tetratricopeptide (TPR) repeat protein
MSSKISLWVGIISISATIALIEPIAIAKTSVEIAAPSYRQWQLAPISQTATPTADDYINSAVEKYGKQDYQGALADFNLAIQLRPNDVITYNNRGFLKENHLQDIQGALTDYNRAIQINPKFAEAYNNRGSLKGKKLQDIQGGLTDINKAIQLNPNFADAYYNRGVLKYARSQAASADKSRQRASAIMDMQQAIKIFQQQGKTAEAQGVNTILEKW